MSCRTLMHSTQVSVTLAINVTVYRGDTPRLITLPLLVLTPVMFFLWNLLQELDQQRRTVSQVIADLVAALEFTGKVITIGFKALAFGMRVTL